MRLPEFKRLLVNIGFDITLNTTQANFVRQCRRLKEWILKHGGVKPACPPYRKPDTRDDKEWAAYRFRNYVLGKFLEEPRRSENFVAETSSISSMPTLVKIMDPTKKVIIDGSTNFSRRTTVAPCAATEIQWNSWNATVAIPFVIANLVPRLRRDG
mmetsp:Transcript_17407/g.34996  ORF Transcript_17407/g.34996 Transcript_17407/m.34996 type:complete len:156 (+) Transcript_17407:1089-1556(+)